MIPFHLKLCFSALGKKFFYVSLQLSSLMFLSGTMNGQIDLPWLIFSVNCLFLIFSLTFWFASWHEEFPCSYHSCLQLTIVKFYVTHFFLLSKVFSYSLFLLVVISFSCHIFSDLFLFSSLLVFKNEAMRKLAVIYIPHLITSL